MTTVPVDASWHGERDEYWSAVPSRRGRYRSVDRRTAYDDPPLLINVPRHMSYTLDAVAGHLADMIVKALDVSTTDFRTRDSLAREFGVDDSDVDDAIAVLGDRVRHPASADGRYDQWYRLTSKGLTRRERWRQFRALAGKTSID